MESSPTKPHLHRLKMHGWSSEVRLATFQLQALFTTAVKLDVWCIVPVTPLLVSKIGGTVLKVLY